MDVHISDVKEPVTNKYVLYKYYKININIKLFKSIPKLYLIASITVYLMVLNDIKIHHIEILLRYLDVDIAMDNYLIWA